MPNDYDLICLGCGPAGEKAATQAAYYGKRVAIVERAARPGGAMVNTGTLPSKALRETALLLSALHRRPIPGIAGIKVDHEISIAKFMAQRHLIEQQEHDRIEQSFDRHGICVHRGNGRLVDAHVIEVTHPDGGTATIRGEYILIATGSSPLRPAHIPFHLPGVVDADGVLELAHLPNSMIIVGGGVIGMEYASIFAEMQVDVTLIHSSGAVLPFLAPECRERLVRAMRDAGVNFVLSDSVESVAPDSGRINVALTSGRRLTADTLLWAAGRSSNTANIGLEGAGVALGERGLIRVDEHYRTNIPSIYAAGDVIGFPALAATSMEQGRIAACHMFGITFKQKLADTTPIGLYTIPAVSMVGMTAKQAHEAGLNIVAGRAEYRANARGRMLGDAQGLLKCVFDRKERTLLGASIVGEDATELIHLAQSLITHGAGIDYLINTCFNYPSLGELFKYAAYSALRSMAESSDDDARQQAA
jgi:NAD(P) transhydrogenase